MWQGPGRGSRHDGWVRVANPPRRSADKQGRGPSASRRMGHNRLRPISGFPGGAAIRFYPASLFVGRRPRPYRPGSPGPVPAVRLARHRIVLDDGLVVGVSVAGRGLPLVVAHGFAAEGLLYTQTL